MMTIGLPETPEVQEIFHLMDVDDNGDIDFREFITGLLFYNHSIRFELCINKSCKKARHSLRLI